jgi:hypothetical protein
MQAEQVDASAVYDRKDWLIGVAALFHLRMNFLWLMQQTHYRNIEQQDASTLYYNINFWGRKNIPADRAAFQVLEELVLHSFDARVVGLLWILMHCSCPIRSKGTIMRLMLLRQNNGAAWNMTLLLKDVLAARSRSSFLNTKCHIASTCF